MYALCEFCFRASFPEVMTVRHACTAWLAMVEAGLESVEADIPGTVAAALDVARAIQSLTDPSVIAAGTCKYTAVSALPNASFKSDKSYMTQVSVHMHRCPYYEDCMKPTALLWCCISISQAGKLYM